MATKAKQAVKTAKTLPLHKAIATGQKPSNYKGAKKGYK